MLLSLLASGLEEMREGGRFILGRLRDEFLGACPVFICVNDYMGFFVIALHNFFLSAFFELFAIHA